MPQLAVETPEGVVLRHEVAGPGSRSAAALIDLLILFGTWATLLLIATLIASVDPTGFSDIVQGVMVGGVMLALVAYPALFAILWNGQTPGKRALGLRVTDANGYPATNGQHVLRSLFWPLEVLLPLPLPPVGIYVMASNPRRQRLGDLVARTTVLRAAPPPASREPYPTETWSRLPRRTVPLAPALAARLDGADYDYLRALLGRDGLERERKKELYVETARVYARRLDVPRFDDARVFLKELYLFLRESRASATTRES